jgi:hypothetical protein
MLAFGSLHLTDRGIRESTNGGVGCGYGKNGSTPLPGRPCPARRAPVRPVPYQTGPTRARVVWSSTNVHRPARE